MTESSPEMRIDKWLWAMRIFKTRALATNACRNGQVRIGDVEVKPSREPRPGDLVIVKIGLLERRLQVVGLPPSRVGAALVKNYCEDHTPPEAYEMIKQQRIQHFLAREKGTGRPTKKERRQIDRLLE